MVDPRLPSFTNCRSATPHTPYARATQALFFHDCTYLHLLFQLVFQTHVAHIGESKEINGHIGNFLRHLVDFVFRQLRFASAWSLWSPFHCTNSASSPSSPINARRIFRGVWYCSQSRSTANLRVCAVNSSTENVTNVVVQAELSLCVSHYYRIYRRLTSCLANTRLLGILRVFSCFSLCICCLLLER